MDRSVSSGASVTVDVALGDHIGEFGRGQRRQLAAVGTAWIWAFAQMYLGILGSLDPLSSGLWACTSEADAECLADWERGSSPCYLEPTRWQYVAPARSIVSGLGLGCRWTAPLRALPVGAYVLGAALGLVTFAVLAAASARRRLLFAGTIVGGLGTVLGGQARGAASYAVLRAVAGAGAGLALPASAALALDVTSHAWRGSVAALLACCGSLGAALGAGFAVLAPAWRVGHAVAGLSTLLIATLWTTVLESPRWLLLRGRKGEATATLAALASANGSRLPAAPLADPAALLSAPRQTLRDAMGVPRLRRLLVTHLIVVLTLSAAYWIVAGMPQQLSVPRPAAPPGRVLLQTGGVEASSPEPLLLSAALGAPRAPVSDAARDPATAAPASQSAAGTDPVAGHRQEESAVGVTALAGAAYDVLGTSLAALLAERAGRRRAAAALALGGGAPLMAAGLLPAGDARRSLAVAARAGLAGALAALAVLGAEAYPEILRGRAGLLALAASLLGAACALPAIAIVPPGGRSTAVAMRLVLLLVGPLVLAAGALALVGLPETQGATPEVFVDEGAARDLGGDEFRPYQEIKRSRSWKIALRRILQGDGAAAPRLDGSGTGHER